VEIADAVQVVVPPRWSETVTAPSEPDITLDVVDATCEPSEIPAVGALIESVPDVRVKDAGVEAPAGRTKPIVTAPSAARRNKHFRIIATPRLCNRERGQARASLSRVSGLGPELDPIDMFDNTCYIATVVDYYVLLGCF
jgi:hypothetical protein